MCERSTIKSTVFITSLSLGVHTHISPSWRRVCVVFVIARWARVVRIIVVNVSPRLQFTQCAREKDFPTIHIRVYILFQCDSAPHKCYTEHELHGLLRDSQRYTFNRINSDWCAQWLWLRTPRNTHTCRRCRDE